MSLSAILVARVQVPEAVSGAAGTVYEAWVVVFVVVVWRKTQVEQEIMRSWRSCLLND